MGISDEVIREKISRIFRATRKLRGFKQIEMSETMMGNAFEALLGAIYIECGYKYTSKYIRNRIIRRYLDIDHLEQLDDNFKSRLLEFCQKKGDHIEYKHFKEG